MGTKKKIAVYALCAAAACAFGVILKRGLWGVTYEGVVDSVAEVPRVGRAMADFETTGKVHYFSLESVRVRTYFSGNANWGAFQSYCERNGLRLEKHADAYDFRDEVKGFGGDPSALAVTFEEGDACTSVEDAELGSIDIHYRRRDGAFLAVWRGKGEA